MFYQKIARQLPESTSAPRRPGPSARLMPPSPPTGRSPTHFARVVEDVADDRHRDRFSLDPPIACIARTYHQPMFGRDAAQQLPELEPRPGRAEHALSTRAVAPRPDSHHQAREHSRVCVDDPLHPDTAVQLAPIDGSATLRTCCPLRGGPTISRLIQQIVEDQPPSARRADRAIAVVDSAAMRASSARPRRSRLTLHQPRPEASVEADRHLVPVKSPPLQPSGPRRDRAATAYSSARPTARLRCRAHNRSSSQIPRLTRKLANVGKTSRSRPSLARRALLHQRRPSGRAHRTRLAQARRIARARSRTASGSRPAPRTARAACSNVAFAGCGARSCGVCVKPTSPGLADRGARGTRSSIVLSGT